MPTSRRQGEPHVRSPRTHPPPRPPPLGADEIDASIAGDGGRLARADRRALPRAGARRPTWPTRCPSCASACGAPGRGAMVELADGRAGDGRAVGSVAFGGPVNVRARADRLRDVRQYEGHGYATEAVRAMIAWAFQQPGVRRCARSRRCGTRRRCAWPRTSGCVPSPPTRTTTSARCWSTPSPLQHPSDRPDQQRQHHRGRRARWP